MTKDFFTDLDRIFLKPLILTLTLSPTLSTLQPPCYYSENKVITRNQQNSWPGRPYHSCIKHLIQTLLNWYLLNEPRDTHKNWLLFPLPSQTKNWISYTLINFTSCFGLSSLFTSFRQYSILKTHFLCFEADVLGGAGLFGIGKASWEQK